MAHCLVENFVHGLERGQALDLGAGAGHDSAFLRSAGFAVTAVDNSSQPVVKKQDVFSEIHQELFPVNPPITIVREDFLALDLGKDQYSLIIAINSLQQCPEERFRGLTKEIRRALKPGGRVILSLITRTVRHQDDSFPRFWKQPSHFRLNSLRQLDILFPKFTLRHAAETFAFNEPHPLVEYPHWHTFLHYVADKPKK